MKITGNITKSAGKYTASVFIDKVCVYRHRDISYIDFARQKIADIKKDITNHQEVIRSFSELEGNVINWQNGTLKYRAKVVGCDYWIGITLMKDGSKGHYATCLRGPLSPQTKEVFKKGDFREYYSDYIVKFHRMVDAIKSGNYDVQLIHSGGWRGDGPDSSSCAFGA